MIIDIETAMKGLIILAIIIIGVCLWILGNDGEIHPSESKEPRDE